MATIKFDKMSTDWAGNTYLNIPDFTQLEENNVLKDVTFYYYICYKDSNNKLIQDTSNIYEIGKIENLVSKIIDIQSLYSSLYNNVSYIGICYKYNDNSLNNSNNNDKIRFRIKTSTSLNIRYSKYDSNLNYFFFYANTTTTSKTFLQTTDSIHTMENNNLIYDVNYYDTIAIPEEPTPEPEPEPEPTEKTINIDFDYILSDIELYYSIDNSETIYKLCDCLEETIKNKDVVFTGDNLQLFFKYKTDTLNNSNYNESLKTGDILSYYDSNLNLFYFGTETEKNNYTTDIQINEIYYNYIKLNLPTGNYTSNITHLNASLYPQDIIFTCNKNYYFSDNPYLTLSYLGASQRYNFTLNDDLTVATFIYTNDYLNKKLSNINVKTEQKTIISDKYGLITLYKPTSDNLKQLSTKLFYKYNVFENNYELVDLSKYILNFISLPLDIPVINNKELTLNGIKTGINLDFIDDNIFIIDFGTVLINGFYNNSIDYNNCEVIIYLPFISNINLDVHKVMNKTIKLLYKVDLFTGNFIAMITDENNILIDSQSGNMSIKIPYITKTENQNINSYNSNNNNLLIDRIPKIKIIESVINENNYIQTSNYTQLNNLSGYNSIDKLELNINSSMTQNDIDKIKSILLSGIIF